MSSCCSGKSGGSPQPLVESETDPTDPTDREPRPPLDSSTEMDKKPIQLSCDSEGSCNPFQIPNRDEEYREDQITGRYRCSNKGGRAHTLLNGEPHLAQPASSRIECSSKTKPGEGLAGQTPEECCQSTPIVTSNSAKLSNGKTRAIRTPPLASEASEPANQGDGAPQCPAKTVGGQNKGCCKSESRGVLDPTNSDEMDHAKDDTPKPAARTGYRTSLSPPVGTAISGCYDAVSGSELERISTSCKDDHNYKLDDCSVGCCDNRTLLDSATRNEDFLEANGKSGCCGNKITPDEQSNCCDPRTDEGLKDCCGEGKISDGTKSDSCGGPSDPTKVREGCCSPTTIKDEKISAVTGGIRRRRRGDQKPKEPTAKEEAMCPCCVQSMLRTGTTNLDIVMSRVVEARERFKKCCIAFADLCCAQSRTDEGCCETRCTDSDEYDTPLLKFKDDKLQEKEEQASSLKAEEVEVAAVTAGSGMEETIVLEVIGMDCPDCLSKVSRAVQILDGAEVKNADGVRGLVNVSYDPRKIDSKVIQAFTARASGFTINLLGDKEAGSGADKVLVLPLCFERIPTSAIFDTWDHSAVQSRGRSGYSTTFHYVGRNDESMGGEVDLSLPLDTEQPVRPRDILASLAPYGVSLRSHITDSNQVRINRDIRNIALRTLAALVLTIPILILVWSPTPLIASTTTSHSIQLILATLIIGVAWPVYAGSFRSAYYLHRADLGVLTSFSTLTSYGFSVVAFGFEVAGRDIGAPFIETVGLLITLIFAGRTLQASTRKLGLRAVDNLGRLQPETARLISDGIEADLDVRLLHYDDMIRVKSGEIVPTDGVLVSGGGSIDESSLTGESIPVSKTQGSTLTAGTTLINGQVDMMVTRLVPENSISAIMDAVSSSSTGSEYQDLADKLAGWLLPIAGTCCVAAFVGWMLFERIRMGKGWGEAIISGVGYAIAIAAVSCPCALAVAVTLVTSVSMASTVQDGVLFRSTQALLTAHSVRAIAFDKTGTLSEGIMTVHASSYDKDPMSVRLIHAVTATNKHPVSETAKRYIEARHDLTTHASGLPAGLKGLDDVDEIPGKGVRANYFGFPVMAGSPAFTNTANHPLVQEYLGNGLTILTITLGKQLIAVFGMRDRPRHGVHNLITHLGRAGRQVALVSGDNLPAVQNFARGVGIPLGATHASRTPVSKGEIVQSLKNMYHPHRVAFVGDGINDTIALSKADISIATGSASNASSQIIILSSDISKAIREILSTSLITRNHVLASLGFCGVYFAVAIVLASGVTGWRIPPAYAGLGELVSVMPVLLVGGHLAMVKAVKRRWSVNKVQDENV